ncbi:hypothetical protein Pint_31157 [Pistacia integerrima]|uniref:Uncharacterized protein n=1 Tax=Pistacia integerrima TaxID=434235 RepID=A0ACC0XNP5_9ROSI|nr:hypothetical protein Pint_31157 [Pistacia integerrima]
MVKQDFNKQDSVLEASENIERIDDDAVIDIIEVEDPGSELEASEQMERRDEDAVIDVGDPLADIDISFDNQEKPSILKIIHNFTYFHWKRLGMEENFDESKYSGVNHLIDFLRISIIPLNPQLKERPEILIAPSVKELHQAGVKFQLGLSKNLFDIRFRNGILEIPQFTVSSSLEIALKNLLAFEKSQCQDKFLNDYIIMMNYLVNTPKDVDILVQHQIIRNPIGDCEPVSSLIHRLNRRPRFRSRFLYSSLVEELNKYCRRPWHQWIATLKQNYFKTPWATVSVIAATVLLILTAIQAICSILQVQ